MRILSPHCGLAAETTSGAELFERELLLRVAGKHPLTLVMTPRAYPRAKLYGDVVVKLTAGRLPLKWWLAPLLLTDAMRDLPRPDLLRVHSLRFIGPAALYARRVFWPGVPIVAHHHHLDGRWNPIERYVSDRVDRVVVGSEFAKRQMQERGWRTDHVRVVPYAVDERFKPRQTHVAAPDRLGGPARLRPVERDTVNVLFLGGLKKRKNVDLLLRIWPEVAKACPQARLTIAGDGPERGRLERMAAAMPTVYFVGYVPEAAKPGVYGNADVFVFPSHMEGFGLPVLEAMASGLPVLVSENGSLPEFFTPMSFQVCDEDGDWPGRLTQLCQFQSLRAQYSEVNLRNAQHYSWDRCVAETLSVYEEVVR